MFRELALITMTAADTPTGDQRFWQTKQACHDDSGANEAFLSGFTNAVLKTASTAEIYEPASELGKELGLALIESMQQVINK